MKCPRDGASLTSDRYEGDVTVDKCPSCGGIWLDSGELRTIQETIENDYSATLNKIDLVARAYELARQKARPEIECPKCGGHLNPQEYTYCSQIMIDRCQKCGGIWLDRGELEALEQFFEKAAEEEQQEQQAVRLGFLASLWQRLP